MSDVERLRAVAKAATPGPWRWEHEDWADMDASDLKHGCVHGQDWGHHGPDLVSDVPDPKYPTAGTMILYSTGYDSDQTIINRADGEHIATFDPPTVLALLDRLAAAEGAVARVEAWCAKRVKMHEGTPLRPYVHVDALRAALAPAPTDDVVGAQRGGEGA